MNRLRFIISLVNLSNLIAHRIPPENGVETSSEILPIALNRLFFISKTTINMRGKFIQKRNIILKTEKNTPIKAKKMPTKPKTAKPNHILNGVPISGFSAFCGS